MTALKLPSDSDLTRCDMEPIHVPGAIQRHGALIACQALDPHITHASSNTDEILGIPASQLIGASLRTVLGSPLATSLTAALRDSKAPPSVPIRLFGVRIKSHKDAYNVTAHTFDDRTILEIERTCEASPVPPLELVRTMLARLQQSRSLHDLCQSTAEQLRDLIGYDRVMIYRFLQDGSGQVIAEARAADQESLLNLRYPATDIPQQARELYKRNWVRLIADVASTPAAVLAGNDAQDRPLDMSYAGLRSVSPIHIEYLKNMGVGASMSISIIVGGELWGLIACHHRTARTVPAHLRAAAELVGQVFSLQIQTVEGIEAYVTMRAARALLDRIVSEFPLQGDLVENLAARLDQLASFVPCDGAGLWLDGAWRCTGIAPNAAEAALLARFIHMQHDRGVHATHQIASEFAPASTWSCGIKGVLAVPLSHTDDDWLFFFRREAAQAIDWGGDPRKPVVDDDASGRLSPRKSFAAWREEVRGQSLPWTSRERLIGDTLRIYLLDIIVRFSEVFMEERRQAEQRQRLMTSELNHQVKTTLELIQSLLLPGYEEDASVQAFVRTLEGRIGAIALAHDSISVSTGSDVRGLIERALARRGGTLSSQIELNGPDLRLDAKAYTVLALVVHELVSNTFAQGALSEPGGRLSIDWDLNARGQLILSWEERGGPPRRKPLKDELGLTIIRRNIPHALGGESELRFDAAGLSARFVIPARFVLTRPAISSARQSHLQFPQAARPLEGYSVLVLDDHITSALELQRMLRERGAAHVNIAGTAAQALDLLEKDAPDVAILDIDLGDETSLSVADHLARGGIPFIFAGHDIDVRAITPQHRDVPVAAKPYAGDEVAELLREALLPHLIRAVLTRLT